MRGTYDSWLGKTPIIRPRIRIFQIILSHVQPKEVTYFSEVMTDCRGKVIYNPKVSEGNYQDIPKHWF